MSGEWVRIECEALADNKVKMSVAKTEDDKTVVEIPADEVASIASALLSAVAAAGKRAGVPGHPMSGEPLVDLPDAQPTGLGIMQGKLPNTAAIVLQFGSARLAVRMADQELAALGQALGAFGSSAPRPN